MAIEASDARRHEAGAPESDADPRPPARNQDRLRQIVAGLRTAIGDHMDLANYLTVLARVVNDPALRMDGSDAYLANAGERQRERNSQRELGEVAKCAGTMLVQVHDDDARRAIRSATRKT
jgi:hypothetical protein